MEILKEFQQLGIIPVVVLNDADQAVPLAKALMDGGLPCAEVTFRTDAARESIARIKEAYPEMLVGAGTVLSTEQVDQAVEAGAQFIVTPGFNDEVVKYCVDRQIPITPGCMDTYAIERALSYGLDTIKFFPAEAAGGIKMIKALSGPYRNLRFIPTGGINADNVTDYLKLSQIVACGGSWMVKSDLIDAGNYEAITELVKDAMALVKSARG